MSVWQSILRFLDASMETPQPYGWFHLMWLALSIGAAVVLCWRYRKGKLQNVRAVVFTVAVLVAIGFNWLAHNTTIMGDSLLNAFYICSQCNPHLPVYSLVQPLLPVVLDEIVYIAGFMLASYLILLAGMGIKRLATPKATAMAN